MGLWKIFGAYREVETSQSRWGLCNIAKLNLIGKVEELQRDLRLFFFYGVGDLDCRICICLRKIV